MSITSTPSRVKVPLHAWLTAGFACLALMVSNGMTVSGLSVYDLAFIEEFGWSMGETKFRDMVTLMLTGLVAPFVGIYIDRFGVRKSMLVGWVVLGLALASAFIDLPLWLVGTGVFIAGILWAFEHPVRRTILGDAAGRSQLTRAVSLDSATNNATRMIGPIAGGVLVEWVGLIGAYGLGVFFYLGAALLLVMMPRMDEPRAVSADQTSIWTALRAGVAAVRRTPILMAVLVVTIVANFFGFAYVSMVPVIGAESLNLTPTLIGVLAS